MGKKKTKSQLIDELTQLRRRILELERSDLERNQMESALRESESHKRSILDASLDRIRHVDDRLRILWANKTCMDSAGFASSLIGQTCHWVFVEKERPCEGCPNLASMKTGQIERAVIYKPKAAGILGDSYWDIYIVPLKDDAGQVRTFFQIARNITDQKRAEDALRNREEMFRGIFTESPIGIAIYNERGRVIDANPAYREIFGTTRLSHEKRAKLLDEPFILPAVKDHLRHVTPVRYEYCLDFNKLKERSSFQSSKTGIIHLDVQITPLVHTDNIAFRGYLVQVQDISRRKLAEEQIRHLTHDLLKAQEIERQKISRELHDRVAQDLSTLKIGFDTLFDNRSTSLDELRNRASRLSRILQCSIEAVRDLSYELRPPGLDQLGLIKTLFQYCEDFSQKTGIRVDFYSAGMDDIELDFDTEINLYRLIQEALNNVRKHADAGLVTIRLVASYPKIILRMEDDGKGFDMEMRIPESVHEGRMGLQNMKERSKLLHGKMEIASRPRNGTKILIEIPLKERAYAK